MSEALLPTPCAECTERIPEIDKLLLAWRVQTRKDVLALAKEFDKGHGALPPDIRDRLSGIQQNSGDLQLYLETSMDQHPEHELLYKRSNTRLHIIKQKVGECLLNMPNRDVRSIESTLRYVESLMESWYERIRDVDWPTYTTQRTVVPLPSYRFKDDRLVHYDPPTVLVY